MPRPKLEIIEDRTYIDKLVKFYNTFYKKPWRIGIGKRNRRTAFIIEDATGREVRILGQGVLHAIVDAVNHRMIE